MEEIERRHAEDLSADEFQRRYVATNTPVIVVGAMEGGDFAAMSRWRLDDLARTHGNLPVAVASDAYVTRPDGVAPLASFLAQLGTADAKWCYAFQDISKDPVRYGSLWDAFEIPGFVGQPKREACVVSRFYVGAAGDGATPHIHSETINLMTEGNKEWLLCPRRDLDAFTQDYQLETHARWFRDTWTNGRACHVWRGIQSAGEILFVPRDAYHATLNQTHTVGVTWRWDPAIPIPTHQPELPETSELEGVRLRRLGTSEVPGVAIGLFGIASDGRRPDRARPFLFHIIPTERERASTVLADLGARLTPILKKLIEDRMRIAGSSGFVIAARTDGTLQVHDVIADFPDAQATLLELFLGESCFNETVRRGLIGS